MTKKIPKSRFDSANEHDSRHLYSEVQMALIVPIYIIFNKYYKKR